MEAFNFIKKIHKNNIDPKNKNTLQLTFPNFNFKATKSTSKLHRQIIHDIFPWLH